MSKAKKIFEDSDDEEANPNFRINSDYATSYDKWRQKEEFQKLKDRYGDVSISGHNNVEDDSSSEDDDNSLEEITSDAERDFLRKLSMIKSGELNNSGTDEKEDDEHGSTSKLKRTLSSKTNSQQPPLKKTKTAEPQRMFLKDYQRKLALERDGRLSDDDEDEHSDAKNSRATSKTYVEEQREIKESFKKALMDDNDAGGSDDIFKPRDKTAQERQREEEEYLAWLKGQKETVSDEKIAHDLKPLHDYWNDPNLDDGERFLRDYILNRRYRVDDQDAEEGIPSYDEIVSEDPVPLEEDEEMLERQEQFEHKYNYRYEEPDPEFVKTYPRTVQDSLRRKDEKRKAKRDDYKQRKEQEKKKTVEEVKRLKNLKRRELTEKMNKLRRIAGKEELPFDLAELEADFDPDDYDKKMKELFNEEYYDVEDAAKPQFSDNDEEDFDQSVEGPDRDKWKPDCAPKTSNAMETGNDEDQPGPSGLSSSKIGKKKRAVVENQLAKGLKGKKPVFNPDDKSFEEYLNEYYKLDFEDVLADGQLCRFKYRKVEPNDFGLSTEEIFSAKDKELNAWVSIKRMSQYRSDAEEVYDKKIYQSKATGGKKKRVFLSLYEDKKEETEGSKGKNVTGAKLESTSSGLAITKKKKRNKKKKKRTIVTDGDVATVSKETIDKNPATEPQKPSALSGKERRKKKKTHQRATTLVERISDARLGAYAVNPKKIKNRFKYGKPSFE